MPTARAVAVAVASCFVTYAHGNPVGPQVISGAATFAQAGKTLSISNAPGTIIQWQGFSIRADEITRFIQQHAASSVLNRVVGGEASSILGQLLSNGRVFLINPNGVFIGGGAIVDTAGFVASSLRLSDADFLAGRLKFDEQIGAGRIVNQGSITTAGGGVVYLVAPNVENHGVITSPTGEVILAAGKNVELVQPASPHVRVELTAPEGEVLNVGRIVASSGRVGIFGATIRNAGTVSANSVGVDEAGRIVFRAKKDITLEKGSVLEASGPDGGSIIVQAEGGTLLADAQLNAKGISAKGGEIQLLGERVGLTGSTVVDASGEKGGGSILVGGDFQGKNPDVQNAARTYVGSDVQLKADAGSVGDGGKVIVWADDITRFYGDISARGGATSGAGGFAEVSGKESLVFRGRADLRASDGTAGELLLDPRNITVATGGTDGLSGNLTFDDNSTGDVTFSPTDLRGALDLANVTLQANNDITVTNGFSTTTGNFALTLEAGRNISIDDDISIGGNFTAIANIASTSVVEAQRTSASAGGFSMTDGKTIATTNNSGSGNIVIRVQTGDPDITNAADRASGNILVSNLNAGAGHVLLHQDGATAGSSILRTASSLITASSLALDISNVSNSTGTIGLSSAASDAMSVSVTNLSARSQGGGIFARSTAQGVTIGGATLGGLGGISNSGTGAIFVQANGTLSVNETVTSAGAGTITLNATGGTSDIAVAAGRAVSSTGGSVVLNADDDITIADTGNVSTTGTGTITLTANATDGNSTGAIQANQTNATVRAGTGLVTLSAATGIAAKTTIANVTATNSTSGDIVIVDTADGLTVSTGGVNQTGTGAVTLTATGGTLSVNETVTSAGNVDLRAAGTGADIAIASGKKVESTGDGTVQLVAAQSITTADTGSTNKEVTTGTSGKVLLSAGTGIGTTTNRIDTTTATLAAQLTGTPTGDIFVRETDALAIGSVTGLDSFGTVTGVTTANNRSITVTTLAGTLSVNENVSANGTGNVDLRATGTGTDIAIASGKKVESTGDGTVQLVAAQSITTADTGSTNKEVTTGTSGKVLLSAGTGIGTTTNRIDTTTATLAAQLTGTPTGDIFVRETDALAIGSVTGLDSFGTVTGVATTNGRSIVLESLAGTVTLAGNVTANGTGNVSLTATGASSDIAINGVSVASGSGVVQLNAGRAITTNTATGTTTEVSTSGSARLQAGTTIGTSANRIETSVGTIAASAAGDMYLVEADGVTVGSVAALDGTTPNPLTGLTTSANNGLINFRTTNGSMTVSNNVSANGSGTVDLRAGGTSSDLAINGATVSSGSGTVQLIAGQAITTNTSTGSTTEVSTTGSALLQAATAIGTSTNRIDTSVPTLAAALTASTGGVYINQISGATNLHIGSVTALDGATSRSGITTTGSSGGTVAVTVGGSTTLTVANAISAGGAGDVNLTHAAALNVNADITAAGSISETGGGTVAIGGTGIRTLTATGGNATFDGAITSSVPLVINAGTNGSNGLLTINAGLDSSNNDVDLNARNWALTSSAAGGINAGSGTLRLSHASNGTITLASTGGGTGSIIDNANLARLAASSGTLVIGDASFSDTLSVGGSGGISFAAATPNVHLQGANLGQATTTGVLNAPATLMTFSTQNGIGSSSAPVRVSGGSLSVDNASSNGVYIQSDGDVHFTSQFRNQASAPLDVSTVNGSITHDTALSSAGTLALTANTTGSAAGITVHSSGMSSGSHLTLKSADDLVIDAGDGVRSMSGNITLVAGKAAGMTTGAGLASVAPASQPLPYKYSSVSINAPVRAGTALDPGSIRIYASGNITQNDAVDAGLQAFHGNAMTEGHLTVITFNDTPQAAKITLENNRSNANPGPIGDCGVPALAGTGNCVGPLVLETRFADGRNTSFAASDIRYKSINGTTIFGIGTGANVTFEAASHNITTGTLNAKNVYFYATGGDIDIGIQIANSSINAGNPGGSLNLVAAGNINIKAPTDGNSKGVTIGSVQGVAADGTVTPELFRNDLKLIATGNITIQGSIYMEGDLTVRADANPAEVVPGASGVAPSSGAGVGSVTIATRPASYYTMNTPITAFPLEVKANRITIGDKDSPVKNLVVDASAPAPAGAGLQQRADALLQATALMDIYLSGNLSMVGGNVSATTTGSGSTLRSTAAAAILGADIRVIGVKDGFGFNGTNLVMRGGQAGTNTSAGGGAIASADALLVSANSKLIDIGGSILLQGGDTPAGGQSTATAKIDPTVLVIRTGGSIVLIGGTGVGGSASIVNNGDIQLFTGGGVQTIDYVVGGETRTLTTGPGLILIGGPGSGVFGANNIPIGIGDQVQLSGGGVTVLTAAGLSPAFVTANSPRAYDSLLNYIIYAANEETRAARVRAGLGAGDDSNLPTCN